MILGVILGSSVLDSSVFQDLQEEIIETKFGKVKCMKGKVQQTNVVIIRRHQFDPEREYMAPHAINYRAMISAFKSEGCDKIVALYVVFSKKRGLFTFVVILLDLSRNLFR